MPEYDNPLSLVYTDIWGVAPVLSSGCFRFYINFVDAKTNFNWVYQLHQKSQAYVVFVKFEKMAEYGVVFRS